MNKIFLALAVLIAGCSLLVRKGGYDSADKGRAPLTILQLEHGGYKNPSAYPYLLNEGRAFAQVTKQKGLLYATKTICAENSGHILCHAFSKPLAKRTFQSQSQGNIMGSAKVKVYLKKQQFTELNTATVNDIIYGSKLLTTKDLKAASASLLADKSCHKSEIYVGVSAILELDFPEIESVQSAKALLLKSSQCHRDDLSKFASYRLGVFNVWGGDCKAAAPQFSASLGHSQNYYQSRSIYWQDWCRAKSADSTDRTPALFYSQFPLSLYPLLELDGERFDAYKIVKSRNDLWVDFRSRNNQSLNNSLELSELFLHLQEPALVAKIFDRVQLTEIQQEPKELQLYIAYLLDRAEGDLLKFQVLSKLFQSDPSLKTLATMKLYYPQRHLQEVKHLSAELDPFLVLSLIRQESAFNKMARSSKNARGLMQVTSALARSYGYQPKEMFEANKNIKAGVRFFRQLVKRYNGKVHLALAAYNAGPKMVDLWLTRYPTDDPILFMDLIPFRETREYVASILRNWYWYSSLYSESQESILPVRSAKMSF